MPKITFLSDKVKISGPRVDNTYTVTLETGEYEKPNLANILLLDPDQVLKVTIETDDK